MAPLDLNKVGRTGYGLMGFSGFRAVYPPKEQAFEAMRTAIESGYTLWNGGEIYGTPEWNSCHLLREYFTKYPEDASKVILSIKGGCARGELKPVGTRENLRRSVEDSLAALGGTKSIDIFECARQDPNVPVEETVGYLAELVKEGKIGGIALSEVSANTIWRASKVHPIVTVEVEVSLWSTQIMDNGTAQVCAELGIPITAYSPVARGALTKRIKPEDIPKPMRDMMPRFAPEALEANNKLTDVVIELAKTKGCTPAQIALSWIRETSGSKGMPVIIPIPGATTTDRVKENIDHVDLTEQDMKELNDAVKKIEIVGARYGGHAAHLMEG